MSKTWTPHKTHLTLLALLATIAVPVIVVTSDARSSAQPPRSDAKDSSGTIATFAGHAITKAAFDHNLILTLNYLGDYPDLKLEPPKFTVCTQILGAKGKYKHWSTTARKRHCQQSYAQARTATEEALMWTLRYEQRAKELGLQEKADKLFTKYVLQYIDPATGLTWDSPTAAQGATPADAVADVKSRAYFEVVDRELERRASKLPITAADITRYIRESPGLVAMHHKDKAFRGEKVRRWARARMQRYGNDYAVDRLNARLSAKEKAQTWCRSGYIIRGMCANAR